MKFLCVPCNTPMTLQSVASPQAGSLAVVFSCPLCGYEMSMLTNPYETQLVQSLGMPTGLEGSTSGAKCPLPAMVPAAEAAPESTTPLPWTAGAEARLANIPDFVRPMARTGVERFARERGAEQVDEAILDAARDFFGM